MVKSTYYFVCKKDGEHMSKKYTVRCKELNYDGEGLVVFNNSKFYTPYVLPGEKCEISLVHGKDKTRAKVEAIIEPSEARVPVNCPVYGKCGACTLLHMKYEEECRFKQNKVQELFKDTGAEVLPFIASSRPEHYRNKIYCSFGFEKDPRGKIKYIAGLYMENTRKICPVESCLLENKIARPIVKTVLDLMRLTGTRAYDPETRTGVLRHAYIRISEKTGKVMLVLVTGTDKFEAGKRFTETLTKKHPCIETIIHNINTKNTGMVLGDRDKVLFGPGFITDEILGKKFKISPHSFYQVNPLQTERLYERAIELAEIGKEDTVFDMYCGTGTISILAAGKAKKVIGVEINKDAVRDAKENANLNNCGNAEFICTDVKEFLKDSKEKADVLIMDPTRNGADEEFLAAVVANSPKRIVYVSCEPVTQARDVKFLMNEGYKLLKVQGVDMFSHTPNTECICLLAR